ncbi:MAG: MCE family protein [Spirochaetaceae bacterium]|nr:MAG: MCE family protein [Spirochaetaceae bacterium]
MKFGIRYADKIVGLFILLALVCLIIIIIVLGANQHWFSKNWVHFTRFETAKGLTRGMPITYKGFEIGRIASTRLDENSQVEAKYYIYDEYHSKVTENSVIELASSPLGSSMLFYPGNTSTEPMPEEAYIPSRNSEEGRAIYALQLAEFPEKSEDTISSIMANVDEITAGINKLLQDNAQELDTMVKSLSAVTYDLSQATQGRGSGPIALTLRNIEMHTRDINGLIPKLLDPTGNEVYPAIQKMLKDIDYIVNDLKKFSTFLSGTTPQITGILEQGRDALDMGKDVLEGLKNNPLLSGGITEKPTQPSTIRSFRDEAF